MRFAAAIICVLVEKSAIFAAVQVRFAFGALVLSADMRGSAEFKLGATFITGICHADTLTQDRICGKILFTGLKLLASNKVDLSARMQSRLHRSCFVVSNAVLS